MSLGYKGYCKLYVVDDSHAMYQYSGENWNDNGKSKTGDSELLDGVFTFKLTSLEEPEVHKRLKKLPSGRKKMVVKRISHTVDVYEKYLAGDIVIDKACKNAFTRGFDPSMNLDYIALHLLYNIYEYYQVNGKLPDSMSFMQ